MGKYISADFWNEGIYFYAGMLASKGIKAGTYYERDDGNYTMVLTGKL